MSVNQCYICKGNATQDAFGWNVCDQHADFVRDVELEIRLTPICDRTQPTKLRALEFASTLGAMAKEIAKSNLGLCLASIKTDGDCLTAVWAAYTPEEYMVQFGEMAKNYRFGLVVHEAAK